MWTIAKNICLIGVLCGLSACASTFSSYDSEFSCKNSDHGGCEHPMTAYKKALSQRNYAGKDGQGSVTASPSGDVFVGSATGYEGYRSAVYSKLQTLIEKPATPIVAPAKTVRTLILPYADPKKKQRLYMERFIFTVVEQPQFVLGHTLTARKNNPFIEGLMSSSQPKRPAGPESQAGKE